MRKKIKRPCILAVMAVMLLTLGAGHAQTDCILPLFSDFAWNRIGDPVTEENASFRQITWIVPSDFPDEVVTEYAALLETAYGMTVLDRYSDAETGDIAVYYAAAGLEHPGFRIREHENQIRGCHAALFFRHSPPQSRGGTLSLILVPGIEMTEGEARSAILPSPTPSPSPTPAPTPSPRITEGTSGICTHCIQGKCLYCKGSGRQKCGACNGSGICPTCHGKRRFYVSGYGAGAGSYVYCTGCGGSGICWKCQGARTEDCLFCENGVCPYCHGDYLNP